MVKSGLPLEDALGLVTINPARRVGIFTHKGSIAPGKDADVLIMDTAHQIRTVIAKGQVIIEEGHVRVKGTFEA